ncbi:MAG: helix-turn-helix transcriptional regulator [Chloroflexota bacterium]
MKNKTKHGYSLKERFGIQLRHLRRKRDYTQEELAESIGVSVEFISNMERGINAPSFATLEKLSEKLRIGIKDLFDFEETS